MKVNKCINWRFENYWTKVQWSPRTSVSVRKSEQNVGEKHPFILENAQLIRSSLLQRNQTVTQKKTKKNNIDIITEWSQSIIPIVSNTCILSKSKTARYSQSSKDWICIQSTNMSLKSNLVFLLFFCKMMRVEKRETGFDLSWFDWTEGNIFTLLERPTN